MKLLPMKPAPPVTSMAMGVKVAGVGAKMTSMATSHRSTIYFESDVLRALKIKSATTDTSVSSIVNDALRKVFAQEVNDLAVVRARRGERPVSFESVVKAMKKSGKI